jgi:hypothetical protein
VHTPFVQTSDALQHGTVAEQLWVVSPHTDAAEHVQCVAPAGMAQESPAQQSPFTVQVSPEVMQEPGCSTPPDVKSPHFMLPFASATHDPLQQSAATVQVPPVSLQVGEAPGGRHAWAACSP